MDKSVLRRMEDYLDSVGLSFCEVCKNKEDCFIRCRQRNNLIDKFEPDAIFTALSTEAKNFNETIKGSNSEKVQM